MKPLLKPIGNLLSLAVVFLPATTAWLERGVCSEAEAVFGFWSQVFALLPGIPGMYLRRAYYRLTLSSCSLDCHIGFGALFTHRKASVAPGVYIGDYSLLGTVKLEAGCLIGSRASLLSGGRQHEWDEQGGWTAAQPERFQQIVIGPSAWIGEAAVVINNIGEGSMVCAGAVVSAPVPARVVVAGNPARFVRRLGAGDEQKMARRLSHS